MMILVHNITANNLIAVNKDNINMIVTKHTSDGRTCSTIYLDNYIDIKPFHVNEVPAMIIDQNDEEFITLHSTENNDVIIIRKEIISVVEGVNIKRSNSNNSTIYLDVSSLNVKPINVYESVEKIVFKLNKTKE